MIQPTRYSRYTSSLLDVDMWLNMFRAFSRPSSGAYNCTRTLWFYRWTEAVGALLVVVSDHDQQRSNRFSPTVHIATIRYQKGKHDHHRKITRCLENQSRKNVYDKHTFTDNPIFETVMTSNKKNHKTEDPLIRQHKTVHTHTHHKHHTHTHTHTHTTNTTHTPHTHTTHNTAQQNIHI